MPHREYIKRYTCVHICIHICMYQSIYISNMQNTQWRQFACSLDNDQCRVKTIFFLLLYKDKFGFLKISK